MNTLQTPHIAFTSTITIIGAVKAHIAPLSSDIQHLLNAHQ